MKRNGAKKGELMSWIRGLVRGVLESTGLIAGTELRPRLLLSGLNQNGLGLEIGPSHAPIAPKREGFRVETLDYTDKNGLIQVYTKMGIDTSRIEEVDHVWNGERYADLVGGAERFDWILASHVFEHVPDLLGTLKQCQEVLKPGGILSIALPDHRNSFDHDRNPSSLASVIDAHLRGDKRPTAGSVAEFYLRFSRKGGYEFWYPWHRGKIARAHPAQEARSRYARSLESEEYQDVHVWAFTSESFRKIVQDLSALEMLDFEIVAPPDSRITEFFLQLRKKR